MPRPLMYQSEPWQIFEVTMRCQQGRFLLRPGSESNHRFLGVLGRSLEVYGGQTSGRGAGSRWACRGGQASGSRCRLEVRLEVPGMSRRLEVRLEVPGMSRRLEVPAIGTHPSVRVGGSAVRPVVRGGRTEALARASCDRLLWLLARERAQDRRASPGERGLTHVDVVAGELGVEPSTVDVYVHRLRHRLGRRGVHDLIERRRGVGQLRLQFEGVEFAPTRLTG